MIACSAGEVILAKVLFQADWAALRVSALVAGTLVQSRRMIVRSVGEEMVMDKVVFQVDLGMLRAFMLASIIPAQSRRMIVCSAGGMMVMDKAVSQQSFSNHYQNSKSIKLQ